MWQNQMSRDHTPSMSMSADCHGGQYRETPRLVNSREISKRHRWTSPQWHRWTSPPWHLPLNADYNHVISYVMLIVGYVRLLIHQSQKPLSWINNHHGDLVNKENIHEICAYRGLKSRCVPLETLIEHEQNFTYTIKIFDFSCLPQRKPQNLKWRR